MPEDLKNMLSAMGKRVANLIPYVVLLSGVVVWSYLDSIGRIDIFPDILSFKAGLMSILVSVMIFALAISMTLIIPSSILIVIKSTYEKNSHAVSVLSKLPAACLCLSILYLAMVFIPFIPEVTKITKGYEPRFIQIISIILFLSFCFTFLTLMRNFEWNKNDGVISNIRVFIGHTLVNLFGTFSATLSISIPISFLMQSSKGEGTTAVIFALLFMIAFSFLTFFPSIIYFTNMGRTKYSIVSVIHQISLAIVGVVLITFLFFPNISTIFIYSSLNAIGLVSKTPHFYLINGEKYKPAMFPKTSWDTEVLSNMGEHFYIKGVNVFSVESKNLICPMAVVKIRDKTYERDYVSFVPFADSKKIAKLKKMTKDCLVLDDGDIQQWDTLFDDNGKVRE